MTWGVFVKKSGKWGCFFCKKKWTFPRRRVHYVQYQYFLFYILLIWGGAYAPPSYGPVPPRRWQRLAADLRPSEVGSAVCISLVAGQLQAASVPIASAGTDRRMDGSRCRLMPSLQLEA